MNTSPLGTVLKLIHVHDFAFSILMTPIIIELYHILTKDLPWKVTPLRLYTTPCCKITSAPSSQSAQLPAGWRKEMCYIFFWKETQSEWITDWVLNSATSFLWFRNRLWGLPKLLLLCTFSTRKPMQLLMGSELQMHFHSSPVGALSAGEGRSLHFPNQLKDLCILNMTL